jgi:hypothetical protein
MSAHVVKLFDDGRYDDELEMDRLPGMPFLGFLTGTVLSLTIWAAFGLVAWQLV